MKSSIVVFAIIALHSVYYATSQRVVIEPEKYFAKLFDNLSAKLFAEPGTLKLDDIDGVLNITLMTKVFDGSVKLHSGFVNRIGKFALNPQKWKNMWNDTLVQLSDGLRFTDFTITYDLDCESAEYSTPSVLMITFSFLEFIVEINRDFEKEIVPVIYYSSIGTISVKQFPDNSHTQIIAKELNSSLKTKLVEAVSQWAEIIQKFLNQSAKEVNFPELCYYCP